MLVYTKIVEDSIAHRAWKLALSRTFSKNKSCPEWYLISLRRICILVKDKINE